MRSLRRRKTPEVVVDTLLKRWPSTRRRRIAGSSCMAGCSTSQASCRSTQEDCWVILHGRVLNVTSFLSQHPGGELAILTFAGKDATAEFDMIHPPDVVGKYAPDAIIG